MEAKGLHDVEVHPYRRAHDSDEARERLVPAGEKLEVVQQEVREDGTGSPNLDDSLTPQMTIIGGEVMHS